MIIKVPIYVELIGKVDPTFLEDIVSSLQEDFYLKLRKRKINGVLNYDGEQYSFVDAGVDDVRLLNKEEALDSLRVKR